MCIACRRSETKRGLLRVVRDQAGRVALDPSGKRPGRGAYLCHAAACWEQALKRHALERALRIDSLHPDDVAALEEAAKSFAATPAAETEKVV